jgi:glycosyltransferase involved in cell wall biosynthesis
MSGKRERASHPIEGDLLLSVLVPAYNEKRTIRELLSRVEAAPYKKQIIVVDDGSTDGTSEILSEYADRSGYTVLRHDRNRGKGAALRTAIAHAQGQVCIVQDADLEYDPNDYPLLVEIIRKGYSDVVYGSRYISEKNDLPFTKFKVRVLPLDLLVRLLYRHPMTDEATCYKAFRTSLLRDIHLTCERFEFCPEVTARVIRRGHRIIEVPIAFRYRTIAEGKKIGWRDFLEAIWCLMKCRVRPEKGHV